MKESLVSFNVNISNRFSSPASLITIQPQLIKKGIKPAESLLSISRLPHVNPQATQVRYKNTVHNALKCAKTTITVQGLNTRPSCVRKI